MRSRRVRKSFSLKKFSNSVNAKFAVFSWVRYALKDLIYVIFLNFATLYEVVSEDLEQGRILDGIWHILALSFVERRRVRR